MKVVGKLLTDEGNFWYVGVLLGKFESFKRVYLKTGLSYYFVTVI